MAKTYKNYGGKPTDITENTFAFILGHLYADAAQRSKDLYEEFLIAPTGINKWTFTDFCTSFNALFNNTSNLIENKANEDFFTSLRDKFIKMATSDNDLPPTISKKNGCMEFYNLYLQFLKILQKSELMDVIKEVNITTDSGY